ncbi:Modular serine protease [Eumeta japonica]|uniref:Modular serine protease n=1 Tax=Eumeta variegata TaxID=151549 RepID=A0A4C1UW34_EUMVA|nr:Modular serine protease [Eumeta japonica]
MSQSDFRKQCESNYPNHSNKKLCQLPPQPHYGGYTAVNRPGAKPGDVFENVTLISFITDENSELAAVTRHACSCGIWAHKLISDEGGRPFELPRLMSHVYFVSACSPLYSEEGIKSEDEYKQEKDAKNVPSKSKENVDQENVLHKPDIRGDDCYLEPHKSVRYQCGDENRDCSREVAHGIAVTPRCAHLHYSAKPLPPMVCSDGQWNYVATCLSECGTNGNDYPRTLAPGKEVKISELPWHAGIYSKDFTPFKQICGGSIIATNLVLTAAHCFWSDVEKLKQPSRFAVAAGQLGRAWDYRGTGLEQKRDVWVLLCFCGSILAYQPTSFDCAAVYICFLEELALSVAGVLQPYT